MAIDYGQLTENLSRFYDFNGKTVLYVGAGGRQLPSPSIPAAKLIAIDQDVESLRGLSTTIAAKGQQDLIEVIAAGFENVTRCGDVVYFEFCLHEMKDPQKALAHAHTLAADIVVFDHSSDSPWAFHAAEDEKVRRSADAMNRFGIRRRETFRTTQRFQNHNELLDKLATQGPLAIDRVQRFAAATNIIIPMSYELALL